MRVLVTADTHLEDPGGIDFPLNGFDAVVHAGDFTSREVYGYFDDHALHSVHGNADSPELKSLLPERLTFEAEGVRVGVLHGHTAASRQELGYIAAELGADLLVHGHTHQPRYVERGTALLNPGSPTRPRSSPPSYAELHVRDGGFEGRILGLDGSLLRSFG